MKSTNKFLSALLLAAGCGLFSASASAVTLPSGACNGSNCLQFGDFQVYSLPLLGIDVSSTWGQNQTNIILGINNTQDNNPSGVDGAFNTPSANNINSWSNMTTDTSGGPGTGDTNGWDASVSALRTSLGTSSLVGFFAFNETGSRRYQLDGVDLLIWVHVQLREFANGQVVGTKDYYLKSNVATNDAPVLDSDQQWAYVHGGICVSGGAFSGYPNPDGSCDVGSLKQQANLGQNNAAFAVYSSDLDNQVKTGTWDTLHIDWMMSGLNGGGETAWLSPFDVGTNVPEPSTLALMVASMLAVVGLGRRQKL